MSENKYKFNDIFANSILMHSEALKKKKKKKEMRYSTSNLKNNLIGKKEKKNKKAEKTDCNKHI